MGISVKEAWLAGRCGRLLHAGPDGSRWLLAREADRRPVVLHLPAGAGAVPSRHELGAFLAPPAAGEPADGPQAARAALLRLIGNLADLRDG